MKPIHSVRTAVMEFRPLFPMSFVPKAEEKISLSHQNLFSLHQHIALVICFSLEIWHFRISVQSFSFTKIFTFN